MRILSKRYRSNWLAQKRVLVAKVMARFGKDLAGKHFALWSLAFKANTDDMRKASSRDVIADSLAAGTTVTAYDPVAWSRPNAASPMSPA